MNPSVSLDNWKTTLTAWFDLNKMDVFAKNINYHGGFEPF